MRLLLIIFGLLRSGIERLRVHANGHLRRLDAHTRFGETFGRSSVQYGARFVDILPACEIGSNAVSNIGPL
jgi:hypothetical protein